MNTTVWHPSSERIASARLSAFMGQIERDHGVSLKDYGAVYEWSITHIEPFWDAVWRFADVVGEPGDGPIARDLERMPGTKFFPTARLNFAENLLRDDIAGASDEAIAYRGEDGRERRLSRTQLGHQVARVARALAADGVGPGDRVAAYLPNLPETVVAMLAAASIGAVFSSCSPDFGVRGVLDRFGQIEAKVLFCADGYHYGGKTIAMLERTAEIARALPTLERIIVVPYLDDTPALEPLAGLPGAIRLGEYMSGPGTAADAAPQFARLGFDHPLYIMYSSGTTGQPKCIVHGAGGTLLQHLKEHQLLCDIKPGDRVFYFTTCGWMMWNWLVSALASGATLLLYDGSPFHPGGRVLFDLAQDERCTLFGTSAKYIDALAKAGIAPAKSHDLASLRTITSTGSPLSPEGFDYVYEHVKSDVCLSSISGGTDIISCFVGGNPIGPVRRGEIQARGLGMAVEVYDADGQSVRGEKGELVCTRPFVSMPVGFWNDPDGTRYRRAYFERFFGVWCHGDFAELTDSDGVIIYGRSDATLNPGGVRIGTAEIYRQVEQLDEVLESIAIGQDWQDDVRVVLFVKLQPGAVLSDELIARIRGRIRDGASPRHVPAKVLEVADIPRTKSGKITEIAVREVVHGRPVKNREALANPEALDLFADRAELRD